MYNSAFGRPISLALVAGCGALLAAAAPAVADDGQRGENSGTADAAVLRTALDVSLLDGTATLPLALTLNEVSAPADGSPADETLLTATLDGVAGGRPFDVLRAEVASAEATVDESAATADSELANARVHLPGLGALSLIELSAVHARAHCAVGEEPVAETTVPATATVLGQDVTLDSSGRTEVAVPGVGQVTLTLGERETADASAAATALELAVEINPLDLNVATVTGRITLAEAACATPAGAPAPPSEEGEEDEPAGPEPQSWSEGEGQDADLAETGGGSSTPYVVGGALALLGAGAATVVVARRRATGARNA
ncbi:hypothetical protein FH609_030015 [Streptomyces sp. 3MP-14]|uniref:LPXTG cell wall anchor domain-containing protein n=1 Tax=Streptomyces mimosae TaxID=2586635 RepID=A0A5N5ZKH8_9ACTN|nr:MULTISPECIES: SCO1860 family LAETG-anchored protein [Streptomyces]KAB8157044.1 hypothetical protein FH607_030600 [Streptomyces mimosae]KAB8172492.1 hypothetical protein FH609_030015 [Streptomyces sp. 3MP-14]